MSIITGLLNAECVAEWEHQGVKCAACANPAGTLNGYALVPDGNPLGTKNLQWGEDGLDVHGGITYGPTKTDGGWLIGWDTLHLGDFMPFSPDPKGRRWTLDDVIEETNRLAEQIKEA